MSEVLDHAVIRSFAPAVAEPPVVTDRDRERVEDVLRKAAARQQGGITPYEDEPLGAPTKAWRVSSGGGLGAVEGLVAVAMMGYFAVGLVAVVTGV
jgi:hypothetical protein